MRLLFANQDLYLLFHLLKIVSFSSFSALSECQRCLVQFKELSVTGETGHVAGFPQDCTVCFPSRFKSESYCRLYVVVPAVLKALSYDEMRGSYSVGE